MKDKKTESQPQVSTTINWNDLLHRLENTQTFLEQGLSLTPERKRTILKERAKTLAREPERGEGSRGDLEVVEFLLSYEIYGIESSFVREVYPLHEITPLPGTPPFVLGIINIRGQILSVLDLKKFFDLPERGLTDLNKVIIIQDEQMEFGILADVIIGVRLIPVKEIQPSLPTLTGIREKYLKGVAREQMVILDAEKLLSDKSIVVE